MPNRYANLTPSAKIKADFQKITDGFGLVENEMDAMHEEINAIPTSDARYRVVDTVTDRDALSLSVRKA